jgi:hypothetical protein
VANAAPCIARDVLRACSTKATRHRFIRSALSCSKTCKSSQPWADVRGSARGLPSATDLYLTPCFPCVCARQPDTRGSTTLLLFSIMMGRSLHEIPATRSPGVVDRWLPDSFGENTLMKHASTVSRLPRPRARAHCCALGRPAMPHSRRGAVIGLLYGLLCLKQRERTSALGGVPCEHIALYGRHKRLFTAELLMGICCIFGVRGILRADRQLL